ncbi:hypothetical protein ACIP5N_32905 [Streptomyces sp. NPDC088768]|uniref:hypothetical protein n=1 Tax=Streptomyces sp. NPDC088768 TaxID=3365894 RepID=UPI0038090FCA
MKKIFLLGAAAAAGFMTLRTHQRSAQFRQARDASLPSDAALKTDIVSLVSKGDA